MFAHFLVFGKERRGVKLSNTFSRYFFIITSLSFTFSFSLYFPSHLFLFLSSSLLIFLFFSCLYSLSGLGRTNHYLFSGKYLKHCITFISLFLSSHLCFYFFTASLAISICLSLSFIPPLSHHPHSSFIPFSSIEDLRRREGNYQ